MKLQLFGVLAFVLLVVADAGFMKELKKAARQVTGGKETKTILDGVTQKPFEMSPPTVGIEYFTFNPTTEAEMKKNFQDIGMASSDSFIETCFNAERQEKITMTFFIPNVHAGERNAAVSVIGIEAMKNEDNSVSVKAARLSAHTTVTALDIFHWRTVEKQFGNQHERKHDEHRIRGLTGSEIQTLIDSLTNGIKNDSRYQDIPGQMQRVEL